MPTKENIEIRSEEVQEIMGQIPGWIIRWGITLIFVIIAIILLGTWFFKYPHIINSPVTITSTNPPADIVAKVNGRIDALLVNDNQLVKQNQILAILENPANYVDVEQVSRSIDSLDESFQSESFPNKVNPNYQLGQIQAYYARFLNNYQEYRHFIQLDYHNKKINSIQEQVNMTKIYYDQLIQQKNILEEQVKLSENEYNRANALFNQQVIASADLEKRQTDYLQKKYALEEANSSLSNTKIQLSGLQQAILDLELDKQKQSNQRQLNLTESIENLKAQIAIWEQSYLLISPFDGKVTFNAFWSKYQNVEAGNTVFNVIPDKPAHIIGKIKLQLQGSGKVKPGQKVNIKFAGYPHLEYGMVRGRVKSISLVPEGDYYMVEIDLPDELVTNYGKKLPFTQEMQGNAEIITDNLRIIERLLNPIRSLLKRNMEL